MSVKSAGQFKLQHVLEALDTHQTHALNVRRGDITYIITGRFCYVNSYTFVLEFIEYPFYQTNIKGMLWPLYRAPQSKPVLYITRYLSLTNPL